MIIKKSPVVFLRTLVVVEVIFALLPVAAFVIPSLQNGYEESSLAGTISYPWLLGISLTVLQILILIIAFTWWYLPGYEVNEQEIVYLRANLFEDKKLADTQAVRRVTVKRSRIARRLNYGTLVIETNNDLETVCLTSVPNPAALAKNIKSFAGMSDLRSLEESKLQTVDMKRGWQIDTKNQAKDIFASTTSIPVSDLVAQGEGQYLEFKASLVWDYRQNKANKALYLPVMKNLVAFMNSDGGHLLIGVGDEGEILGLEPDLSTLPKANLDGFENVFNSAFRNMVGVEFRPYLDLTFPEVDGLRICQIYVKPSPRPAYLRHKGSETFYIRAGNGSQPLPVSKAARYIRDRFETV